MNKDLIIAKQKELINWLEIRLNDLDSFDKYNELTSELSALEKEVPNPECIKCGHQNSENCNTCDEL